MVFPVPYSFNPYLYFNGENIMVEERSKMFISIDSLLIT